MFIEVFTHRFISLPALLLATALPADAQTQAVAGHVVDPQNRWVVGASVELTCPSFKSPLHATSDADGAFRLVPAGARPMPRQGCTLTVEAKGFTRYRSALTGGTDLTVSLELPTIRSEVTVTSSMPELATERRLSGEQVGESGVRDLAELFRDVDGMSAVRRGPINLEPTIRGLQEEQVGMFVDGTRTFAAGPGRMDSNISHVGTHATQNLRVIKGPYALAWGAGTLSALEIETVRPEFSQRETNLEGSGGGFRWYGNAGIAYGDNAGNTDSHLGIRGSNAKFRFYVGSGRREGDDYQAGDGSLVPGGYESTETRWRFGFQPSERVLMEYTGGYQEQFDVDYPGRLLDAIYFYARSHALELTWSGEGTVSEVYGQLYANHKDHLMNNDEKPTASPMPGRMPPFGIEVTLPTESNTEGGRFRVSFERGAADWSFGTDYYKVEQTATRTIARRSNGFVMFADAVWPDATIEDLGGWGQVVWAGGGDGFGGYRVGATLRFDDVDADARGLSPFFLANTAPDSLHEKGESHLSAAISSIIDLGDHWSLSLGAGRAVRTATVLERWSDRFPSTRFQLAAELMGNPALEPEQSLELNLGGRASYGDLLIEIETFYRRIDDYITVVPDPTLPKRLPLSPPVVFRYVNGSEATFYGGELLLRQRLGDRVSWRGSLAYVRGHDRALDEPVLGVAPLSGEVGVRFHTVERRLWIDLASRFAGRQERVATSRFEQETPGWAIYNLSAGFELARGWKLTAAVENLTDHAYAEHLNSPNPFTRERIPEIGRNLRLGLAVDF